MGDAYWGPSNIPLELVTEILSYLPVKSLIRFTCVCKSWLSLIRNDRHFAIKHYHTRISSASELWDPVDYIDSSMSHGSIPCLYSFTKAKTFRFSKKFECVPDVPMRMSNSCHGIICFHFHLRSRILLCNPSIQEFMLLPRLAPCSPCSHWKTIALGFDPINNDYKVVAIGIIKVGITTLNLNMNIYSIRQGHWRHLPVNASLHWIYMLSSGVSNANGRVCNWFAYKSYAWWTPDALISFDMVEEVLKEVPMPKCRHPETHEHQLLSSSRWQACLSCSPKELVFGGGFIDVWVLKENGNNDHPENREWSKEFTIICPYHEPMRPLSFWINDKELLVYIKKENVEEVFYYDISTHQLRRTGYMYSPGQSSSGYVESLVSIKHFKSLHHECKNDDGENQNENQDDASKQEDNVDYIFREVSRKGVRWFRSFKFIEASN